MKSTIRKNKEIYIFLLFSFLTAFVFAVNRMLNADFVPYNGDFQNYNIFRRLLAGQLQYKDFVNYLGVGAVAVNLPFVAIFNSFGNSVFITNFTTSLLFSLMIFVACYVISKNKLYSARIASCISILSFILVNYSYTRIEYYRYVYTVAFTECLGHSMRTTRGVLPYLFVLLFLFVKKNKDNQSFILCIIASKTKLAVMGFLIGAFICWSNDFGLACFCCSVIILFMITCFYEKRSILNQFSRYSIFISTAILGFILSVTLVTGGHPFSYLNVTQGIAQYQFWYYQNEMSKMFTIDDIFSDELFVYMSIVFFLYAFKYLYDLLIHKISDKSTMLLFLLSTNYAAALVYVVGSGHHNYFLLQLIIYFVIADAIISLYKRIKKLILPISVSIRNYLSEKSSFYEHNHAKLIRIKNRINWKIFSSIIFITVMCCLYIKAYFIIENKGADNRKDYIEKLEVNTLVGTGIEDLAKEVEDQEIFSTYATALETINEKFQPTGIDYIIHVLGDQQRVDYLNNFIDNEYQFATTLKQDYTTWEYWAIRANWFFYRELYKNYHPVNQSYYSILWERGGDNSLETDINLNVNMESSSVARISIELPEYKEGAYVDLKISYEAKWNNRRLKDRAIRKCVRVQDGGQKYNIYDANSCYYLRDKEHEGYIPVFVNNGKAEIWISSAPTDCTELIGLRVEVMNILEMPDLPTNIMNYSSVWENIVDNVISPDNRVLTFANTECNEAKLRNATVISANGESVGVDSWADNGDFLYAYLQNEIDPENFRYPNQVVANRNFARVVNATDDAWLGGVLRNGPMVLFPLDLDVNGLYAIKCEGIEKKVTFIENKYDAYWGVALEDSQDIMTFGYPANIELIYK